MNLQLLTRFFMPYLTGPACVISDDCPQPSFPRSTNNCTCEVAVGGINELYFIPCTETFSMANVVNPAWWAAMLPAVSSITGGILGRSGLGLGSIAKKTVKTDRVASCRGEQVTGITWALKFIIKCFDKTSARSTSAKLNELVLNSGKYLVAARMCDGDDVILPIGLFTTSDIDWTVPDNIEDNQSATLELSWKELGFPATVDVPGLSVVLPKLG